MEAGTKAATSRTKIMSCSIMLFFFLVQQRALAMRQSYSQVCGQDRVAATTLKAELSLKDPGKGYGSDGGEETEKEDRAGKYYS